MTSYRKGYSKAVCDALMSLNPFKYPIIFFMDGDGQYCIDDVHKIFSCSVKNPKFDMVVGGRVQRAEPAWRKLLTVGLQQLESILFRPPIKDVTSALRLMDTKIAQELTSQVKYSPYNFWLEFTARMSARELKIIEIPVNYIERENGDSQVYSLEKMPEILWAEIKAVFLTYFELNMNNIIKFAMVGASGAFIILFVTWSLTELLDFWYIISVVISLEISIIWAFTLNTVITFKYKFINLTQAFKALIKYHGTAFGGMLINLIFLYILTEYFSIYYLLSEFIALIIAFVFNYLASTRYVWKKSLFLYDQ